jgi:hypothetical protein
MRIAPPIKDPEQKMDKFQNIRGLDLIIALIILVNAVLSVMNLIQDGALLRRLIPAVCWSLGFVFWIIYIFQKEI